MTQRYFSTSPLAIGKLATLAGPEAHHLRDVMRMTVGQRVTMFDGGGSEFVAEIRAATRSGVQLEIVEQLAIDREAASDLTLGVALPKGERQRWLVEKAVELGVSRLVPLHTQRGVAEATSGALDRLRRGVIEAAKQCGRNRLMEIGQPQTLASYLAAAPAGALRLFAQPGAAPAPAQAGPGAPIWLCCGPEGGFTGEEAAAALAAGWTSVSLGPRTLRVETAALALATLAAAGYWEPRSADRRGPTPADDQCLAGKTLPNSSPP